MGLLKWHGEEIYESKEFVGLDAIVLITFKIKSYTIYEVQYKKMRFRRAKSRTVVLNPKSTCIDSTQKKITLGIEFAI